MLPRCNLCTCIVLSCFMYVQRFIQQSFVTIAREVNLFLLLHGVHGVREIRGIGYHDQGKYGNAL